MEIIIKGAMGKDEEVVLTDWSAQCLFIETLAYYVHFPQTPPVGFWNGYSDQNPDKFVALACGEVEMWQEAGRPHIPSIA